MLSIPHTSHDLIIHMKYIYLRLYYLLLYYLLGARTINIQNNNFPL